MTQKITLDDFAHDPELQERYRKGIIVARALDLHSAILLEGEVRSELSPAEAQEIVNSWPAEPNESGHNVLPTVHLFIPDGLCGVQSVFRIDPKTVRTRGERLLPEEIERRKSLVRRPLAPSDIPDIQWRDTLEQFFVRADDAVVTEDGVVPWGHLNAGQGIVWTNFDPTL